MLYNNTKKIVDEDFEKIIIPNLSEFIKIENGSPNYDTDWESNGKLEECAEFLKKFILSQKIKDISCQIYKEKNYAPFIYSEIPAFLPEKQKNQKNILLYSHFDKQPPLENWSEGLHPRKPILKNGKIYGRGTADDGYAIFSLIECIKIIQQENLPHGEIKIIIEGAEESGSPGLIEYLIKLKDKIKSPDLMICLDSVSGNYENFWMTTSLRGNQLFEVDVECLKESVHSGVGSGITPEPFTVLRCLLDRIENSKTHESIDELQVKIPENRLNEIKILAKELKEKYIEQNVKILNNVKPISNDITQIIINNTWKNQITVTGMTGFPKAEIAGNILRKNIKCRLSVRTPPTMPSKKVEEIIKEKLTTNVPFNSIVTFKTVVLVDGWNQKDINNCLVESFNRSSKELFNKECYGKIVSGITIPFIKKLENLYPNCNLVVSGLMGNDSNCHCIDECLDIEYCKKLIITFTHAIYDFSIN